VSDLTSSAKYPEVKKAAEHRQRWRAISRNKPAINLLHSSSLKEEEKEEEEVIIMDVSMDVVRKLR